MYQPTGYEDHEVIGRNCQFLQSPHGNVRKGEERRYVCHPADLVTLTRELEGSSVPVTTGRKAVDLLFRARSKSEGYVWVESREQLRVEPGKRQKAIILNERVGPMPMMRWGDIVQGGGIVPAVGGRGGGFEGC